MGLDGQLLKTDTEVKQSKIEIVELSQGCICCSLNVDFSSSVLTIENSLNPDYLIVEPSGIAHLSKVINNLKKICYERIEILAPIFVLDGENYKRNRIEFKDYFNEQIRNSGTIVVSKSENFTNEDYEDIKSLACLSENSQFYKKHYDMWNNQEWDGVLSKKIKFNSDNGKSNDFKFIKLKDKPKEMCLENISILSVKLKSENLLIYYLELLILGVFGKVYRAKGFLEIGNNWVKFDLVQGKYSITGCEKMSNEGIVIIGKNLKTALVKKIFESKDN